MTPDLEAAVEYLSGEVEYAKGRDIDNVLEVLFRPATLASLAILGLCVFLKAVF